MSCGDCKDCRFWVPAYSSIGECTGQGTANSKFWLEGKDGRLLTQATHGCRHFEDHPKLAQEIL